MKITKLTINNVYSFKSLTTIRFEDQHSLLIGPNNVGKSNIFRILQLFLEELETPGSRFRQSLQFSDNNIPFVILDIKLIEQEVNAIIDFFNYYVPRVQTPASDSIIIKNRRPLLRKLDEITIKLTWDRLNYPNMTLSGPISIKFPKIKLEFLKTSEKWQFRIDGKSYEVSTELFDCLNNFKLSQKFISNIKKTCAAGFHGIQTNTSIGIGSRSSGDQLSAIMNLLRYYEPNVSMPFLSIISRLIESSIYYISNNRNVLREETVEYPTKLNSDASNLTTFLHALSISEDPKEREKFEMIRSKFRNIFNDEMKFEIVANYTTQTPNAGKRDLSSLSIVIVDNALHRHFYIDEVGTGIREVLFFLAVLIGTNNSIILFEEPTLNLHLLLIRKTIDMLLYQAKTMNNQIIIISHSSYLVHRLFLESDGSIYYFRKRQDNSTVIKDASKKNLVKIQTLKTKLSYIIYSEIFFANKVIVTEGESDKIILSMASDYFRAQDVNFDVESKGILILNAQSADNFAHYLLFFKTFNIPFAMIGDNNMLASHSQKHKFFAKATRINSSDLIGNNKEFYVIDKIGKGNIEDLMYAISPSDYKNAEKYVLGIYPRGNKPLLAYEFMNETITNNPIRLKVFRDLLDNIMTS